MAITTVRRIASDILGAGTSRIRIRTADIKKAEEALTRDDVRALIGSGIVYTLPAKGVSRARARIYAAKRAKGRKRGRGTVRGRKYATIPRKDSWMAKARAQRGTLRELVAKGRLAPEAHRPVYRMVKGQAFRSRAAMMTFLKESNLLVK